MFCGHHLGTQSIISWSLEFPHGHGKLRCLWPPDLSKAFLLVICPLSAIWSFALGTFPSVPAYFNSLCLLGLSTSRTSWGQNIVQTGPHPKLSLVSYWKNQFYLGRDMGLAESSNQCVGFSCERNSKVRVSNFLQTALKSSTPKDLSFDVMSAGSFLIACLGRAETANLPKPSGFSSQLPINLRQVCGLISRFLGLEDAESTAIGLVLRLFSEREGWSGYNFLLFSSFSSSAFSPAAAAFVKRSSVPQRKSASDGLAFPPNPPSTAWGHLRASQKAAFVIRKASSRQRKAMPGASIFTAFLFLALPFHRALFTKPCSPQTDY